MTGSLVKPVGVHNNIVPVLSLSVHRYHSDPATSIKPIEVTATEVDNYYITPEDAQRGPYGHHMSFLEALSSYIF